MLYAVVSNCENFAEIYIPVDYSPAENVGGIVGYNRSAEISFSINNGNLLKEGMGGIWRHCWSELRRIYKRMYQQSICYEQF